MNTLRAIKTKKYYRGALGWMENIFDAKPGTKEGTEAEVLMILISDYERINHSIDPPSNIEAIRFRMEQLNLQQKDLIKISRQRFTCFGNTERSTPADTRHDCCAAQWPWHSFSVSRPG